MGHPAAALAWLANALAARGEHIEAGSIVLSGGLTASVALRPRRVVTAEFDGLGRRVRRCTGACETMTEGDDPSRRRAGRAARRGETLLRALAGPGCATASAASAAGCGICKVQLVLGEVRYERPIADSVLSDDERVEGICLSCRAVPITDIVIELQEGDRLRRVLGFAYPNSAPPNSTRTGRRPTRRRGTTGRKAVDDERRHPAGVRAPAGDRPRRGPQPLLEHPRHGGRARGARQAVAQVLGRVGPPLPGARGGRGRAGQARLQGREPTTPWPTSSSAPSSSARPPAGSAPGRTSRSATACGSPCRPSTPSSCTPTWSSSAPTPGRSTPRRGRATSAGSARTGSTTR